MPAPNYYSTSVLKVSIPRRPTRGPWPTPPYQEQPKGGSVHLGGGVLLLLPRAGGVKSLKVELRIRKRKEKSG